MNCRTLWGVLFVFSSLLSSRAVLAVPSPTEMVQEYVQLWKGGNVEEAVKEHWSVPHLLAQIYGEDYTILSDRDKDITEEIMSRQIVRSSSFKSITTHLSDSRVQNMRIDDGLEGSRSVSFETVASSGKRLVISFKVVLIGNLWKIIDRESDGQGFWSVGFTRFWEGIKGKMTVLETMQMIDKLSEGAREQ
jgi:hypothetical protein